MSDTPRASNQRARPDRKLWPLTAEGDNLFNHELQMWQYDEIDRLQKRVAELERCQHAGWDYAREIEAEYRTRTGHGFGTPAPPATSTQAATASPVLKLRIQSGMIAEIGPLTGVADGEHDVFLVAVDGPRFFGHSEPPVALSWRCFHCGEVFTDERSAADHFGPHQGSDPACRIDITEYRRMEESNRRHCEEDTELHRALHAKDAEMHTKVRQAEEQGYARGLEDAKKHPETLGLQRAAEPPVVARHLDEWHEDIGDVVWWKFPMDEPAYIGSPLADDWPGYHTHWTPHPAVPERIGYPSETKSGGISCQCPAEPNEPCPLTDEECRKRALRRSTSGETGACRQYIPFRYGDASKCANCGQPDIKHTSDERVRAMNLCDRCGTWHLESPAPRNCKECGKRMGSGMVRTPDGDPAGGVVPVPAGGYADTGSAFRAPVRKTE